MKKPLGISAALIGTLSVLAVGGVHTQVVLAVLLVAFPAAFYVVFSSQSSNKQPPEETDSPVSTSISLPSLIFSVFAFICFLQILPLPPTLHEVVSPQAHALYLESLSALDVPQASRAAAQAAWRPISLDPGQTADRGLRWIALALIAVLAARLGRERGIWRDTLRAGVLLGWVHLGVAWIHHIFEMTSFFGVYQPLGNWPAFSMFVNANQGASFYGLAALAGMILGRRNLKNRPIEAFLSAVSAIVFVLMMLALDSKGVNLAFSLAAILYIGQSLWMAYRKAFPKTRNTSPDSTSKRRLKAPLLQATGALAMLSLMSAIITLPLWLSHTFLWPWVQSTPVGLWVDNKASGRIVMIESGMRGALDYPFFGSGAGSIERVIAPYMDWTLVRAASIPTLENQFADWFLAMGYPAAIAALVLFLSGFIYISRRTTIFSPSTRSSRSTRRYLGLLAFAIYVGTLVQMHFPFFALGMASCIVVIFEVGMKAGRLKNPPDRALWVRVRSMHIFVSRRVAFGLIGASVMAAAFFTYTWTARQDTRAPGIGERAQAAASAELGEMVRWVPSESRIFTALAFKAAQADDGPRAIALAEHAFKLEPRSNELLFLAHIEAHFGSEKKAAEQYARLFSADYLYTMHSRRSWVSKYLLRDIDSAELRAQTLQDAPAHWSYALEQIQRRDGSTRAIEFALAIAENHPDDFYANKLVVDAYLGAKQFVIGKFWAETMVSKDWPDPPTQKTDRNAFRTKKDRLKTVDTIHPHPHTASLALVARALAKAGDKPGARRYLLNIKLPKSGAIADEIIKVTLELLPDRPAEATPDEVAFITRATRSYCHKKRSRREQLLCWKAEAWLDERHKRADDAELVWKRIARDYENPLPLADFFVRQRKCVALEQLIAKHTATRSRRATKWLGRLKKLPPKCAAN